MEKVIQLEPIRVVYTSSIGDPSHSDAFLRLEKIVPLKGNKFYATYDPDKQEYCACAEIKDDMADQTGLPTKTIDGGWYASTELVGSFSDIVKGIAPAFEKLSSKFTPDRSRLSVEFYKRHTHVILYLPIVRSV